ncbi:hypothetical protein [Chryseobacterium sp. WLY505]|uniref:hypothetical protein n=1 Tax=Chryseobacterium sp. WLY505 TaxID=3068892 RepID=UPI00279666ED|nr:hypothetical protein [Chryseobacterium sp. WLY505]MDQ1859282.1 hypothetical protein [Chryseobacterium sp. WLY505]
MKELEELSALQQHRNTWKGKSDEWLFERLNNELKMKIEAIQDLKRENEGLLKIIENIKKENQNHGK